MPRVLIRTNVPGGGEAMVFRAPPPTILGSYRPGPRGGDSRTDMKALVLVDFDDTIVETAPAFHRAREALFSRLEEEGFPRSHSFHVHHDIVEPELLALFGMGPFRMEPSFRDTYVRLCVKAERSPDPRVAEACGRLGREFLGHPRVMEGSLKALEALARRCPTILYSQASHPEYQMGRIRDAGVAEILGEDRIRITARKTPQSFLETVRHFRVHDPASTLMIGNSLRSDINPALVAGADAILVEPYEMWEYDRVPPVRSDFKRFETFREAVDFLLANGSSCDRGAQGSDGTHSSQTGEE